MPQRVALVQALQRCSALAGRVWAGNPTPWGRRVACHGSQAVCVQAETLAHPLLRPGCHPVLGLRDPHNEMKSALSSFDGNRLFPLFGECLLFFVKRLTRLAQCGAVLLEPYLKHGFEYFMDPNPSPHFCLPARAMPNVLVVTKQGAKESFRPQLHDDFNLFHQQQDAPWGRASGDKDLMLVFPFAGIHR